MKSFSPAGMATKAYYGLGARTFGNPGGALSGNGSFHGGGGGGGFAFSLIPRGIAPGVPNGLNMVVAGAASHYLAAGGSPAVWRSTNDGTSWAEILSANIITVAGAVAYDSGSGVWLFGDLNGRVLRSLDDGLTWGAGINTGLLQANALASDGAGNWVALFSGAGPGNYAVSTDNGLTWAKPALFTNGGWNQSGVLWDGAQFVALGSQVVSLLSTINTSLDGQNWVETVLDPVNAGAFFNSPLSRNAGGRFIIGSTLDTTVRIAASPAALAAAPDLPTSLTPGDFIDCVVTGGAAYYAVDGNTGDLTRSTDGGLTWVAGDPTFAVIRAAAFDAGTGNFSFVGDNNATASAA